MKKILLGTSALAAAALVSGAASADSHAGGAPTLSVSGGVAMEYVFFDNSERGAKTGRGHAVRQNEQAGELHWDATGAADNGLEYHARVDMRYARDTGELDESWIHFSGSWGRVVLGGDDGAEDMVMDGNNTAVAAWHTDGNAVPTFTNFAAVGTDDVSTNQFYFSAFGATGDANKIGYYTPNFSGFAAGITFAPNSGSFARQDGETDQAGNNNVVETAVTYNGDFGGVSLGLGGAYVFGDDESTNGNETEDIRSWHIGANVGFAGFLIGAGYVDSGDSGNAANVDSVHGWNLGVNYAFDALSLSANYQATEQETAANVEDSLDVFSIGAQYAVSEGLTSYAQATWLDVDNGSVTGTSGSNDAAIFILGTRVNF